MIQNKHTIIFLAGGNASRFDQNKLITDFLGKPLFARPLAAVQQVAQANPGKIEIIAVSQYEHLLELAQSIAPQCIAAFDPDCSKGLSYSIKAGLQAADKNIDATFVLADQPLLQAATLQKYFEQYEASGMPDGCFANQEQLIAPVTFSPDLFKELEELEKDQGGKRVLVRHLEDVFVYQAPAFEMLDVDTPDQLEALKTLAKELKKSGFLP
jgi:molybdenum cofactor cytidylyltransferase